MTEPRIYSKLLSKFPMMSPRGVAVSHSVDGEGAMPVFLTVVKLTFPSETHSLVVPSLATTTRNAVPCAPAVAVGVTTSNFEPGLIS